jgi:hypothetical protein
MIKEFQVPESDALVDCLLMPPHTHQPIWDAAVYISTKQAEKFYSDVFHFWVRAFFCFAEDMELGSLFQEVVPFIECNEITPEEFRRNYFALLHQRVQEASFIEAQKYPETYTELEKRSFSHSYVILDHPNVKSCVAGSDGEYLAYFHLLLAVNH